jgi:hypothetical protein
MNRAERRRAEREMRKAERRQAKAGPSGAFGSTPLGAARAQFMTVYGATMVMSLHVQYRLADVYAASFDDPRSGSIPRFQEKWREAFEGTLGKAHAVTREWLPPSLRTDVACAVEVRNYLAHYLIFDSRGLQDSLDGLLGLIERLMVAFQFFSELSAALLEQHKQVCLRHGVSAEVYESRLVPFGQLSDPDPPVALPKKREKIVAAYSAVAADSGRQRLYFENDAGAFWQATDVGLATARVSPELRACSVGVPEIQRHLPATVVSRPSRDSNPPAWRSPFNYDLEFSTGVTLRLERVPPAAVIHWEIIPTPGRGR